MGTRHRKLSIALTCTLAATAAAPAASQADVYCVATSGGDCTSTQPDLQTALNLAGASGIPDTVRVGPGTQTAAATGYDISGDDLALVGAGAGQTTLTMPASAGGNNVLATNGGGGITVSDLRILIPAPIAMEQYRGIDASNVDISRLRVEAPVVFNGFGIAMAGGTVDDTTIDLPNEHASPTNRGLTTFAPTTVTDSTITADEGILHAGAAGNVLTVARTTVDAASFGVQIQTGAADLSNSLIITGNTVTTASRAISIGNPNGMNVAQTTPVSVDGLTLVGRELNPTIGVEIFTNANPAFIDDNSAAIRNTIFAPGIDTPVDRSADEGSRAVVTTAFSDLDAGLNVSTNDPNGMTAEGLGSISSLGGDVNVDPGFVNAPAGNYHLSFNSPLTDAGDPAAPPPGSTDRDGHPRAFTQGTYSCPPATAPPPQRRDIGAFENFASVIAPPVPACIPTPNVQPTQQPKTKTARKCKKAKRRVGTAAKGKKCKRTKKRGK